MKCPDCGFECLPGDEECLACGVHIGSALENKEKERLRAIEANERKAQYELEMKKELGLISEEKTSETVKGSTLEETFRVKPRCPKCGAEHNEDAVECVRCGVIFDKLKYGTTGFVDRGYPDKAFAGSVDNTGARISQPDMDKTEEINHDFSKRPRNEENDLKSEVKHVGKKSDKPRELSMRSFQRKVSTWEIYRNKIIRRLNGFINMYQQFWGWFKLKSGSRNRAFVNASLIALVFVLLCFSPVIFNWSSTVYHDLQKKIELKRHKSIGAEFFKNKDQITAKLKKDIVAGNFEEAEKTIMNYDVPLLEKELAPLKNFFEENIILKSLNSIPADQLDRLFKDYLRLTKLAPDNHVYKETLEKVREDYAEKLYMKAAGYRSIGKKDPEKLDQAISSVKKAVEVMPGSSKYRDLRTSLMKEKLLFYEGNDKIAMAVRDDGMGQRLLSSQRKISVWILNRSSERVFINVQLFFMTGKDGVTYTYNDTGTKLSGKLEPGEQTYGELYFKTGVKPSKITFNHLVCGAVTREFP